jgi:DNA polymerase-3 subunit epsilon
MDRRQFLGALSLPAFSTLPLRQSKKQSEFFPTKQASQITGQDRQISIAIDATGPTPADGHRIVAIAAVEIVGREVTGAFYHRLLNPERDIGSDGLVAAGITRNLLNDMPRFADIADELSGFIENASLISHDTKTILAFLKREFFLSGRRFLLARAAIDTFELARNSNISDEAMDRVFAPFEFGGMADTPAFSEALLIARLYLALTI